MAEAKEDTELVPSTEQNKMYMYISTNYSSKTTECWMDSFWQQRDWIERPGKLRGPLEDVGTNSLEEPVRSNASVLPLWQGRLSSMQSFGLPSGWLQPQVHSHIARSLEPWNKRSKQEQDVTTLTWPPSPELLWVVGYMLQEP